METRRNCFKMGPIVSRRVTWIYSTISQIEYKLYGIYEGAVKVVCAWSTMLFPVYLCWECLLNIRRSCVPSTFLCIFFRRRSNWIYEGSQFDQRLSVSWSGPVFDPRSSLSLLGEQLCIFVGRAWDWVRPNMWRSCVRSTLNATPHKSTSNHVGGKEAVYVNSNYL